MKKLVQERQKAIKLRKKGLSYNEIIKHVPVAKSTLSLWLKDLPLTKSEKTILKSRKDTNISRGRIKAAAVLRQKRLVKEKTWIKEAKQLFILYENETLFHAGITMYWAEGAKTSNRWMIINTDSDVIELMMSWLLRYLEIPADNIQFRLFIHKPYADGRCERWWQHKLGVSSAQFLNTVYKPTIHKAKQKPKHQGCLRLEVKNSKKIFFMMRVFQNLAVESYRKQ